MTGRRVDDVQKSGPILWGCYALVFGTLVGLVVLLLAARS